MWVLLQRSFTNYRRDRRASYVLVARLTFCSLLPLQLWSRGTIDRNRHHYGPHIPAPEARSGLRAGASRKRASSEPVPPQSRAGFLFTSIMFAGFVTMNGVLLLFPEERPVFMREVRFCTRKQSLTDAA